MLQYIEGDPQSIPNMYEAIQHRMIRNVNRMVNPFVSRRTYSIQLWKRKTTCENSEQINYLSLSLSVPLFLSKQKLIFHLKCTCRSILKDRHNTKSTGLQQIIIKSKWISYFGCRPKKKKNGIKINSSPKCQVFVNPCNFCDYFLAARFFFSFLLFSFAHFSSISVRRTDDLYFIQRFLFHFFFLRVRFTFWFCTSVCLWVYFIVGLTR